MSNNYNVKDLREKLDRCKNMDLKDVSLDDVDEISSIKIDRRTSSNERILDFFTKTKIHIYLKLIIHWLELVF